MFIPITPVLKHFLELEVEQTHHHTPKKASWHKLESVDSPIFENSILKPMEVKQRWESS